MQKTLFISLAMGLIAPHAYSSSKLHTVTTGYVSLQDEVKANKPAQDEAQKLQKTAVVKLTYCGH